jgi:5-formyltetrahydrofolate cyclo-ligase
MHFREIRREIPMAYRKNAAHDAATLFIQQEIFRRSEHIASYCFFRDEFDAEPLMEAIWQAKKQCYLPVLTEENTLRFIRYDKGDVLHPNRYSILEPVNMTHELSAEQLDIVITPLIAFDNEGHRLGTGGGYYDKTFTFLQKKTITAPSMIGLAYAAQRAENLPWDRWDVSLSGVLTEKEFINFSW